MKDVSVAEAKEHLEELIARARRGEAVCIVDAQLGGVRLAPLDAPAAQPERRPGRWKGRLNFPDDAFLEPMSEEDLKAWNGDDLSHSCSIRTLGCGGWMKAPALPSVHARRSEPKAGRST